jgi:polysaccharide deacetylase family protein (PEP-CTERM system associated)
MNEISALVSTSTYPESSPANPCNVISVDVEDYFHAEIFSAVIDRSQWTRQTERVEANTMRLLQLFGELKVEATFFILGWVAERWPRLVRAIADHGHELACHSYWHRLIYQLKPDDFREDTRRAKAVIEQAAGQQILGYRAPTYSIASRSLWALDILAELGFSYDSSIFPIYHDRYGVPHAPRLPFRLETSFGSILEFPLTTFRLWGRQNFPVAGGGYLRLLPWWYTELGLRRAEHERVPVIAYIHPWEIDPDQPRLPGTMISQLRHYRNLGKTYDRLKTMLGSRAFTSFRRSGLDQLARAVERKTLEEK